MMFRDLQLYERSIHCECRKCVATCKAMPGVLAPGDMDRIALEKGVDPSEGAAMEDFVFNHFVASDAANVRYKGKLYQVPTIAPAQEVHTGRCVFLDAKNRCTVHRVAPFGCAKFRMCSEPEVAREDGLKAKANHFAIARSADYMMTWSLLHQANKRPAPVEERRRNLNILCREE